MKKVLTIVLIGVICLSMCSCSQGAGDQEQTETTTEAETQEIIVTTELTTAKPEPEKLQLGHTYVTDTCEITINNIVFKRESRIRIKSNEYFSHEAPYGYTMIVAECDVKNLQAIEDDIWYENYIYAFEATYDGKYKYNYFDANGDFPIRPLASHRVDYYIEVPEEVETSAKSLEVLFEFGGIEYIYTVR